MAGRFSWSKGAAQGASWAPIGAKIGGPKGAGLAAGAGFLIGGFNAVDDKLDTSGYLKGLQRYEKNALSQTRRATNELGSRIGSNLAARGINDSGLAEYINQSNRGRMYGQTLDHLNSTRANMEIQLAHAQEMLKQARSKDERDAWTRTTNQLYDWMMLEYLKDMRTGWDSPEGKPITPEDLPLPNNPPGTPPAGGGQETRPPTVPTPQNPIAPLTPTVPNAPYPDAPPRMPPPFAPVPGTPEFTPNAPSIAPTPGSQGEAGAIWSPEIPNGYDMQQDGTGIFRKGISGEMPSADMQIGLDIEGDPMYEGWKKTGVQMSPSGERYPTYEKKDAGDEGMDALPMSYDSPEEAEIYQTLGVEVGDYLKKALGDRFTDIMTWG